MFQAELTKLSPEQKQALSFAIEFPKEHVDLFPSFSKFATPPIPSQTPTIKSDVLDFYIDPRFGVMVPKEQVESQRLDKLMKESTPKSDIVISDFSKGIFSFAKEKSDFIRGLTVDTSKVPKEIKESAGFGALQFGVPRVRESVARLVEFGGIIPATTELMGKTAISEPDIIPSMAVVGTIVVGKSIVEQAQKDPAQLVSDLLVGKKAFDISGSGVGKLSKVASDFKYTVGMKKPVGVLVEMGETQIYARPTAAAKKVVDMGDWSSTTKSFDATLYPANVPRLPSARASAQFESAFEQAFEPRFRPIT